ncbi:hypothetical protein D3C71_1714860 [compost metagenome]
MIRCPSDPAKAIESGSGKVHEISTPSNSPGMRSAGCVLPWEPPEQPALTVNTGTPKRSIVASFDIIAASLASTALQLFDACWSVLANVA